MHEIYHWDEPLRVRMFGKFVLTYKGQQFSFGKSETKLPLYVQFMLLLWLRGERGATTDEVVKYIYADRPLKNPRNSVNNLIRTANRLMVGYGLPDTEYFCRIGRYFRAAPDVPLEIDVTHFRNLIMKARNAGDAGGPYYREAIGCYQGALLPELADAPWVAEESFELSSMYREACDTTAQWEIESGDMKGAESVYEKAHYLEPGGAWEPRRIEILLRQGRDREAVQVYERTIQRYIRNIRGMRADRIFACAADMNSQLLEFIQETEDVFIRVENERAGEQTRAM